MKNLYLFSILLITTQLFSNKLAWVDEQIEAIKPARVGISDKEISKIKDPFIFLHKKDSKEMKKTLSRYTGYKKVLRRRHIYLKLDAILNKSAMINGKWYKQGSYVHGYKLVKVNRKSILLIRKNKKLLLSTVSRSNKIKINNK